MLKHALAVLICATSLPTVTVMGQAKAGDADICVTPLPPPHNQCDRPVEVWWRDSKACKAGCTATVGAGERLPGTSKGTLLYTWTVCEKGKRPEAAIGGHCK